MDFSFVPSLDIILPACLAVASAAAAICITTVRLGRIKTKSVADAEATPPDDSDLPKVSIVVYARDDAEQLSRLLPSLLDQDYPMGKLEVIVVNEGQGDATAEVVNTLAFTHPNLYLTFTPDGARNLSRKKLALTLGIKAARFPVVAMLDADTEVRSPQWLRHMARHFTKKRCEVVIGAAAWDGEADNLFGSRHRAFDHTADTVTYLAPAICRHPYRGTSHNLLYKRELFFANKGFSRSLNLRNGDDDIFVSEIARRNNTKVELSPESITIIAADNPKRIYRDISCSHLLSGQHVSKASRRLMGFCSLLQWIWLAASIWCVLAGLPSLLPAVAMLALAIIKWTWLSLSLSKCTVLFAGRALGWSLPWLIISRPIYSLIKKVRAFRYRNRQYTWS